MAQDERTRRLEQDGIRSLLMHYTVPAVVGTMVSALYNVVDRIFIGQNVGTYAMAGLALTFPILIFLQAFGMLVGAGAATRVSILLGEHRKDAAEAILGNAILLTIFFQVITIIPTFIWMEDVLVLFGGSPKSIPYAIEYLQIAVPGNIFGSLAMSYNAVMRASGYPKKAMYTMLIGAVLNTILDALFIYGFGWGIAGAAWATVISMVISAVFVMHHFFQPDSLVRFARKNFRISRAQLIAITSIGISPFAVQLLGSISNLLINRGFTYAAPTTDAADMAIGALGIINSYAMLAFMFMLGISQGMQPIVGYNHGAGLQGRVFKTYIATTSASAMIGLTSTLLGIFIPEQIVQMFTADPPLIEASTNALRHCLYCLMFVGTQVIATQFFQSIGRAKTAFWLSISRQLLFLIPALLILPEIFGINGVWISLPISDGLAGVMGLTLTYIYFRRRGYSIFEFFSGKHAIQ